MTEALIFLLMGVAIAMASALLLQVLARKCRLAPPGSAWQSESVATVLSLCVVALIVVSAALTIKATVMLLPDALSGIAVGLVAVVAVMFATIRIAGKLPSLADEGPETFSSQGGSVSVKRAA